MNFKSFFPILESTKNHSFKDWRKDFVAGLTVAVMLVPQGMAYASLAEVPPIYGLYAGLVPLFLYGILGTSRQLSIGPVAISSLLVVAGVSQIAEPMTDEYISLVIIAGLLIGIIQMLIGVFRLGFLVNFISHPVIIGFTSAAAVIIAFSQLKDFLGIKIPRFDHFIETGNYAVEHFDETNWIAVLICIGGILVMAILKKLHQAIPRALIITIIGTCIVYFFGEKIIDVDIIKDVPKGLPSFNLEVISLEKIILLIPTVLTVTVIGIVESIGIAKVLQSKHRNYQIRPNRELFALGISKIGGSFFQAIPSSGSFTRSAINNEAGASSGMASIFTSLMIGLTLLFFTPLFYYLPKAILAAIILFSVKGLFEWKEAVHLWKNDRQDFFMMLTTFIVTLILGIEEGVLAGVVLSIGMVLFRSSRPHISVLGKLPDSINYRSIDRFESAEQPDEVLIMRFDDQLYFGNADYFKETILKFIFLKKEKVEIFILDASSIHELDSTGAHAIEDLYHYFKESNIEFYISGMIGPFRDKARKVGLLKLLGEKKFFLNIHQAVTHFKNLKKGESGNWSAEALQTNVDSTDED